MVVKSVKFLKRTDMAFLLNRPWIKWREVLNKCPGTYAEIGRFYSTMKILCAE